MKHLIFPILFCLTSFSSLLAQEIRFISANTTPSERAERRQAYMAGDIDAILLNRPSSSEVILDLHPNFHEQGYRFLKQGKMKEAQQAFETFLTLAPEEAIAYYGLGDYYFLTQDYHRATLYYERATDLGMKKGLAKAEEARIAQAYYEIEAQKEGW